MPRAIWSGPISFGLVNIPISLFPATESKSVSFHQLHAADKTPIRYAKVCPLDQKTLTSDEIVKGYEFEKGRYVVMEDKDFQAAEIKKGRTIEILNFVTEAEIDPLYLHKSYYLAPVASSVKAFRLLLTAMARQGKAALAKFVLRDKQRLALLRPRDRVLVLSTLFYEDEIRATNNLPQVNEEAPLQEDELELAEGLIARMTQKQDLAAYKDEYREELLKIINRKIEGKEVTVPKLAPLAPVIDIMDALKESISRQEQAGRGGARRRRKKAS